MPEHTTTLIERLVEFALAQSLVEPEDRAYVTNRLLERMGLDAPQTAGNMKPSEATLPETASPLLAELSSIAAERGLIGSGPDEADRFSAALAGEITPSPAEVRRAFAARYAAGGPQAATDWFYHLCRACDYIRVEQVAKNVRFFAPSPCGELEITINLSKPEKDPRDIAALRGAPQVGYPKCMLCVENTGYAGRADFPARQNHRMVPLALGGEIWYLQYSPYLYYPEHCIALSGEHRPMRVDRASINRLFDFVQQFPHYFIGSNADLPIVGGSILNHDHFQGGRHSFPMDRAGTRLALRAPVDGVDARSLDWPMTTIRLTGRERGVLIDLAVDMLDAWRGWSDPSLDILARTDAPHNAITPILRRQGGMWRLDLVLRNNRASAEHPLGIFHPHASLHHIKKENIGLIEVMGLFVLPGRLKADLDALADHLSGEGSAGEALALHREWMEGVARRAGAAPSRAQAEAALKLALAEVCSQVLADAGVYKRTPEGDEGLLRFLRSAGYSERAKGAD
ncbi:MAG: UDP-glucose--hexose-1-phosphate uridylyltransferase [Clostridiales bacterium]|nr:UDP-glucose--hexose-1-phosphate uridylyltransferase [Clostridiales bacterium]